MYLFLAQTAAKPPIAANFIFIGLLFFIFYFLIIRPQKRKQAEHHSMVQALKKNDEVITIGGIHGTVIGVKDKSVILRVADNVKIEIQKSAIAGTKKSSPDVSGESKNAKT